MEFRPTQPPIASNHWTAWSISNGDNKSLTLIWFHQIRLTSSSESRLLRSFRTRSQSWCRAMDRIQSNWTCNYRPRPRGSLLTAKWRRKTINRSCKCQFPTLILWTSQAHSFNKGVIPCKVLPPSTSYGRHNTSRRSRTSKTCASHKSRSLLPALTEARGLAIESKSNNYWIESTIIMSISANCKLNLKCCGNFTRRGSADKIDSKYIPDLIGVL